MYRAVKAVARSSVAARHASGTYRAFSMTAQQMIDMRIYWGSQTGTAQNFAQELADAADYAGVKAELVDLKTFKPEMLTPDCTHAFLVACYGMGEPTDNARKFYEWVSSAERSNGSLKDIPFAVFGLGSKKTHAQRFCLVGIKVDQRFEELGGTRVWPRVDGDDSDCIEAQFDDWQRELLENIAKSSKAKTSSGNAAPKVEAKTSAPTSAPAPVATPESLTFQPVSTIKRTNKQMFRECLQPRFCHPEQRLMPILSNFELTPNASPDRSIYQMSLSLNNIDDSRNPQTYVTGDHVIIHPRNDARLVDDYLNRIKFTSQLKPTDTINIVRNQSAGCAVPEGTPAMSYQDILTNMVDLMSPPGMRTLRLLADQCTRPEDVNRLRAYAEKDSFMADIVKTPRSVLDILRECPSLTLTPERFLSIMPSLQSRCYSVSSSNLKYPDEIHATYRVCQYRSKIGIQRDGVCTNWLKTLPAAASPLVIPDNLKGYVPAYIFTSQFKLPKDTSLPIIMVGGGVGMAPFKAFVEEREMQLKQGATNTGPFEFFFGSKNVSEYAYEDLFNQARKDNVLTHYAATMSDGAPEGYQGGFITDAAMKPRAAIFWEYLQAGGYVYVCGGAGGFGPAVTKVIKQDVLIKQGNMAPCEADTYFNNLLATGRYLEDLAD